MAEDSDSYAITDFSDDEDLGSSRRATTSPARDFDPGPLRIGAWALLVVHLVRVCLLLSSPPAHGREALLGEAAMVCLVLVGSGFFQFLEARGRSLLALPSRTPRGPGRPLPP